MNNISNNNNCVDEKRVPITINIDKVFNTYDNGAKILETTIKNNERQDHVNYSLYNRTFDPYKENISILIDGKTTQSNTSNYKSPPCFDIVLNKWPRSSKEQFNELPGLKIRADIDKNNFWGDKLKDTNTLELDKSDFPTNYSSGNCPKSIIELTNNGTNPPTGYLKNIDIDSRLKNIDYKRNGCGKKEFKNPSILSSECDSFFEHDYYDPNSVSKPPITNNDDSPFRSEWTKHMTNDNNKHLNRSYVYNNSTDQKNDSLRDNKTELLFNNNTRGGACSWPPRQNVGLYGKTDPETGEIKLRTFQSKSQLMTEMAKARDDELIALKDTIKIPTDKECVDVCYDKGVVDDKGDCIATPRIVLENGRTLQAKDSAICSICFQQNPTHAVNCDLGDSPLNNVLKAIDKKRDNANTLWVQTDGIATWSADNCKYNPDPTGPSQYGPRYQEVNSGVLKDMWDNTYGPCRGKPTAAVRPEYSNWETATLPAGQTYPVTGKNKLVAWTPEFSN